MELCVAVVAVVKVVSREKRLRGRGAKQDDAVWPLVTCDSVTAAGIT